MNAAKAISEKKNSQVPTGCVVVFGLAFLLAGLIGLWFACLRPSLRTWQASSWPTTEATITLSKVHVSHDDDGTTYKPEVHFSYRVDGQALKSESWSFSVWSGSQKWSRSVVDRYPVGSKQACFYNPRKPGDAVLDRSFQWGNLAGLFLLIFVAVGAGVLWIPLRARFDKKKTVVGAEAVPSLMAGSGSGILSGAGRADLSGAVAGDSTLLADPDLSVERPEAPWEKFDGPQRLEPAVSRTAKFVGALLVAAFWNGLSWFMFIQVLRTEGWLSIPGIFLTLFVVIGAGIAGGALYLFLSLFNPDISVALSNGAIPVGENVDVAWETKGNSGRISELKIGLVGQEKATYTRGTSTYTDKKEFARIEVVRTSDPVAIQFGSTSLQIPAGTMHSFNAGNNKIEWSIEVHGVIAWWPDVRESMQLAVKPAGTGGTPPGELT